MFDGELVVGPAGADALPEHVQRNRAAWDEYAAGYVDAGQRNWAGEPHWGIWGIPEADVQILPTVAGLDCVELGCGTGYVSAWLMRRGARVTGIDNSPEQLASARRFQQEFGLTFPLLLGNAESTPFPDASFDLAISEYGACLWADPHAWVPEAARILRPGGRLIFLTNSPLLVMCEPDEPSEPPAGRELLRDYFGMGRMEWAGSNAVEFHLGHGDWFQLLRANGFAIEDLRELQPPPEARTGYTFVTLDWARRWPSEEVWIARKHT